ncbi:MAG TPA: inositol monophosphatase family protein [Candidatus Binatia bacterium]|jgi:myo-inositol-1(or 4)-monophosphatase|nr:inositol monophosphatase family protein [Candidatus Binatia bacterium]
MDQFLTVALEAAHQAGALLRSNWLKPKIVEAKTDIVDLVTNVDKAADALITGLLRTQFPTHKLIAEESAVSGPESPYQWYIDPLDGTTNFAHGFPHFAVSIALAHQSQMLVGVVYDPLRDETFCASRGHGATLNGKPVHVSQAPTLDQALVLTGFPYDRRKRSEFYLRFYQAFMMRTQGVRRSGSAALDLCYVACGRADAFWEWRLHPWDTAAGSLLVEEAGGRMSNFVGAPFEVLGEQTLAANGLLHQEMVEVLQQVLASPR